MTTTKSSTVITIQTLREGSTALSISYDYTDTDHLTRTHLQTLQSLIAPAIEQWWHSLSRSQKSVLGAHKLSLKILATSQMPPRPIQPEFF